MAVHPGLQIPFEEERRRLLGLARCLLPGDRLPTPLGPKLLTESFRSHFRNASAEIRSDSAVAERAMLVDGELLSHCAEAIKDDFDIVKVAVRNAGKALRFASQRLRADKVVVLSAVEVDGLALQYASEELRADEETVLAAVFSDWSALRFASAGLRANKDVVLKALESSPEIIRHASLELRDDREVAIAALGTCTYSVHTWPFLSQRLREDKDIVLLGIQGSKESGTAYRCYEQAYARTPNAVPWNACVGAAASRLAVAGQSAPILSVTIYLRTVLEAAAAANAEEHRSTFDYEATLLSGNTVASSIPNSATTDVLLNERPFPILNSLAESIVEQLQRQSQENAAPERVFLVIQKEDGSDVPVTPWDWDRPLIDYLHYSLHEPGQAGAMLLRKACNL